MNVNLLKSKMALNGDTQTTLAEAIGITQNAIWMKMNNRCEFKRSEIEAIAKRYNLTGDEIQQIFF
ncbi:MAG: helix-turn-helix transcriptional regulator [Alphaproteobacteria bacterium]|nr:helix-turn-helix transcriptional regulator [Alphaproteobacteria bacterium]